MVELKRPTTVGGGVGSDRFPALGNSNTQEGDAAILTHLITSGAIKAEELNLAQQCIVFGQKLGHSNFTRDGIAYYRYPQNVNGTLSTKVNHIYLINRYVQMRGEMVDGFLTYVITRFGF